MSRSNEMRKQSGTGLVSQATLARKPLPVRELSSEPVGQTVNRIGRVDQEARNRLVLDHLGLVVRLARKFLGRGLLLDDLVGEGNLGLIHAAEVYDPAYQTRFSTYASYWIEEAIRDALINRTAMIRLPAYMVGLLSKWDRARRTLNHEADHPLTSDEVAKHLGLTKREQKLIQMAQRTLRRQPERGIEDHDGQSTGGEPVDNRPGPDDRAQIEEQLKELEARMGCLDEREQKVIEFRFGLRGQSPRTLREIGENMGCTREWISRLERRAIDKLGCLLGMDEIPSHRERISV